VASKTALPIVAGLFVSSFVSMPAIANNFGIE